MSEFSDMVGLVSPSVLFSVSAVMFDPFLAMVDLMGEGMVDLNVRFTFSLLFQVFHGRRTRDRRTGPYFAGGGTP
jgi:hypothetical protein